MIYYVYLGDNMVIIILFIILILFTASMTILLYTRPRYRHIPDLLTDDIDELFEDKRDV